MRFAFFLAWTSMMASIKSSCVTVLALRRRAIIPCNTTHCNYLLTASETKPAMCYFLIKLTASTHTALHWAPLKSSVVLESSSKLTSGDTFIFLEWICIMRARASSFGWGNSILRSKRPDLSNAGSKISTRLVAAITYNKQWLNIVSSPEAILVTMLVFNIEEFEITNLNISSWAEAV